MASNLFDFMLDVNTSAEVNLSIETPVSHVPANYGTAPPLVISTTSSARLSNPDVNISVSCFLGAEHLSYSFAFSVVIIAVYILASAAAVFGNLVVVIAVLMDRSLRAAQFVLYVNLAVSDLLVGVVVIPASSVFILHTCWPFPVAVFRVWISFQSVCTCVSFFSVCAVACERYIVIKFPLCSRRCETRKYKRLFIAVSWCLPIAMALPTNLSFSVDDTVQPYQISCSKGFAFTIGTLFQYIPAAAMVIIYVVIYREIRIKVVNGSVRMEQTQSQFSLQGFRSAESGTISRQQCRRSPPSQRMLQRHRRSMRMLGTIITAFIICMLPWFIVWPLYLTYNDVFPIWITKVTMSLMYFNSAVNPFIYTYASRDFRTALVKLWSRRRLKCRRIQRHESAIIPACQSSELNLDARDRGSNRTSMKSVFS